MSTLFSTLSTIDILAAFSKTCCSRWRAFCHPQPTGYATLASRKTCRSERAQVRRRIEYVVLMLAGAMLVGSLRAGFLWPVAAGGARGRGMIVASIAWRMLPHPAKQQR